jgi:hypothetical protein
MLDPDHLDAIPECILKCTEPGFPSCPSLVLSPPPKHRKQGPALWALQAEYFLIIQVSCFHNHPQSAFRHHTTHISLSQPPATSSLLRPHSITVPRWPGGWCSGSGSACSSSRPLPLRLRQLRHTISPGSHRPTCCLAARTVLPTSSAAPRSSAPPSVTYAARTARHALSIRISSPPAALPELCAPAPLPLPNPPTRPSPTSRTRTSRFHTHQQPIRTLTNVHPLPTHAREITRPARLACKAAGMDLP